MLSTETQNILVVCSFQNNTLTKPLEIFVSYGFQFFLYQKCIRVEAKCTLAFGQVVLL